MSKYHFFFGGFLSQWYPCAFTLEGRTFNCAEQYMMYQKARMFRDPNSANAIMRATSPYAQKMLGRKVRGFDVDEWNAAARDIVFDGNVAKFMQNSGLREMLDATSPLIIVEASPTDRLWGIGLPEGHRDCEDPSKWRGANWLGEVLMAVRAHKKPKKWSDTIHKYTEMPPV